MTKKTSNISKQTSKDFISTLKSIKTFKLSNASPGGLSQKSNQVKEEMALHEY